MTFPVFASGDVLNASDMNAVGLWLVKTQTIGTAVSSVTVTGAFSSDYENYRIIVNGGVGSNTTDGRLTLGSTATGYYATSVYTAWGSNTVFGSAQSNAAFFAQSIRISPTSIDGWFDLRSPNLAKATGFSGQCVSMNTADAGFVGVVGYLNDSTQYTAFTITPSAGTMTGGTIRVYGYRN